MTKDQRMDPAIQAIDDAIKRLGLLVNPWFGLLNKQQKRSVELGIAALRNLKVCTANSDKALAELLEKIDDIRRVAPFASDVMDSVVRLIKGELKSDRQTGPAIGQTYWIANTYYADSNVYEADDFDLNLCKYTRIYPERRFAEAELRAKKLIRDVNKRRRELNERKESGDRKFYIEYWDGSRLVNWESIRSKCALGLAYPFGLFKDFADCETCVREFEDELEWFSEEYLPLMEELDNYDWAEAPGWGGKV